MHTNIVVEIGDGTYSLEESLRFSAADSGRYGHRVIWRAGAGAHPVFSGARQVTGWTRTDPMKNIWRAPVPAGLRTRQLYVDGKRAPVAQGAPPLELKGDSAGYTAADATYSMWRNPEALEFVYPAGAGAWTEPRCRLAEVQTTRLIMSQPCWNNLTNRPHLRDPAVEFPSMPVSTSPSRLENAYELIQPGQWCLDTNEAALYYRARSGFDPNRAQLQVPVLEQLLVGEGTLDEPVHDIRFEGLEFAYATWNGPSTSTGFAEVQANITATGSVEQPPQGTCSFSTPEGTCPFGSYTREPGSLTWRAARHIEFVGNTFTHLGASGLVFEYGSQDNLVQGNSFTDISGNAVQVGDTRDPHPADVSSDEREVNAGDVIANNLIHDIGVEFHGAVGILLFFVRDTIVRNNEIRDVPYTAISLGAVAGHADTPDSPDATTNITGGNQIRDNVIYHYMSVLNDGGAIYLEGHQNETVYAADGSIDRAASYAGGLTVSGNVAYDQGGTGNAYYDDIGSQWVTWSSNVQWQAASGNGGCLPVGHIRFVDNYHSDGVAGFGCGQPIDVEYRDNSVVSRQPTPDELPRAVLAAAGLQPPYRGPSSAAPPVLEYASLHSGLAAAGMTVLVGGSGFDPASRVSWADAPAIRVEVVSSNFLVAQPPAGADLSLLRVANAAGSTDLRIDDTHAAIVYRGAWTGVRYPGNYADESQHVTQTDGDSFEYEFEGSGIDFITAEDSNRGGVEVYVDGALSQRASCFAPSLLSQQVCARASGLEEGPHVLRVVKTGGVFMTLDALQVRHGAGTLEP